MTPAGQPDASSSPAPACFPPAQSYEPVRVQAIPAFAPVAIQLLNIVSQENVGLNRLAALIRADPGLSIEVLRLANSPLFGARREITGILHAISMLGLNRIKSMAMTVAVRDFLAPARAASVFAPCWRHSLATAFIAEEIGGEEDRDSNYTGGLIHNVGQLALIAARPGQYDNVAAISQREGRELLEVERECFGIDGIELGVQLFERWKLPSHFRPVLDPRASDSGVGAVVRSACAMARMMGFRVGGREERWDPARLVILPPSMTGSPAQMEELVAAVATKINTVECSLVMV